MTATRPTVDLHHPARRPSLPDRVVVINDVSVARGGATTIALASARELGGRGIPITFLSGDDAGGADGTSPNTTFIGAGEQHIMSGGRLPAAMNGLYNSKARRFLSEWIQRNDTPRTIYHLHGWSKILSPSAFKALAPVSDRLFVTAHDFFLACPNGGYFDFVREEPCQLTPMSAACLARNCDRRAYAHKVWRFAREGVRRSLWSFNHGTTVLAVHDSMIPHLARGGIARDLIKVLRNPVTAWSEQRVAAERNRDFFYVGRLEQDKGVDLLAGAARRAGVRVHVVGTGPLAADLAKAFPELVMTGWSSHSQLSSLIQSARALVMPSRYREPFGIVAFEALLSGVPVVVSQSSMIAQEVIDEDIGVAVDPYDEAAFAAELAQLAGDDRAVAAMSQAARRAGRLLAPSLRDWGDQLIDLYSERCDERAVRASSAADGRLNRTGKDVHDVF